MNLNLKTILAKSRKNLRNVACLAESALKAHVMDSIRIVRRRMDVMEVGGSWYTSEAVFVLATEEIDEEFLVSSRSAT